MLSHSSTASPSPSPKRFIIPMHDQDDDHHHQGDGRAEMRVVGAAQELHLNEVPQQQTFAAAQQAGDHKGGNRRDEYHGHPREDSGQRQREDHLAEDLGGVGAQVLGRLNDLGSIFSMTEKMGMTIKGRKL